MRLFVEIRRRGLLRVAAAYLGVSWLALEIGHTLFNIFELPHAGLQFVLRLLVLGRPVVLLGSWQGWFKTFSSASPEHAEHLAGGHEHAPGGHESTWIPVVFAAVALFAIAVAIGVRFFGMGA